VICGLKRDNGTSLFDDAQYRRHEQRGLAKYETLDQEELIRGRKQTALMSKEEFLSIYLYTCEWTPRDTSIYMNLNRELNSGDRSVCGKWKFYLHYLFSAFKKVPPRLPYQDLYRGISRDVKALDPMKYTKDNTFTEYGVMSTTCHLHTVSGFLGQGSCTLFTINDIFSARSIAPYSALPEDEFVFPPTTRFHVVSSLTMGRVTMIQLRQLASLEQNILHLDGVPPTDPTSEMCDGDECTSGLYWVRPNTKVLNAWYNLVPLIQSEVRVTIVDQLSQVFTVHFSFELA
jgi:hypothetical protein